MSLTAEQLRTLHASLREHTLYDWAYEEVRGSLRMFSERTSQDPDEQLLLAMVDLILRAYDMGHGDAQ